MTTAPAGSCGLNSVWRGLPEVVPFGAALPVALPDCEMPAVLRFVLSGVAGPVVVFSSSSSLLLSLLEGVFVGFGELVVSTCPC